MSTLPTRLRSASLVRSLILLASLAAGVAACGGDLQPASDLADPTTCASSTTELQRTLLAPRCGSSGCHDAAHPTYGLDLVSPGLEARVIGAASIGCTGERMVIPGDPERSQLYVKIAQASPECGRRMPQGAPALSASQLACVAAWIRGLGAPNLTDAAVDAPTDGAVDASFDVPMDARVDVPMDAATCAPGQTPCGGRCLDPALDRIWQVGLHTMRMCSHETFEDCPHYEQMQYAGDTMITSKLGMLTTGDYRLSRQALYHFDWSRLSDGLTQARFPSRLVQIIPAWSIHWITNIKDYFYCTGDRATVRDLLPGVRAVLDWYRRHTDADGLPAKMPFWNITDWCPWWPRGVVPGADTGTTCIHSAQYINALDEAALLVRAFGGTAEADALTREAADLRRKAHALFWSESEGLYFDRPGGPEVSQYGNAWAIVAGLAGERERAIVMQRFPNDPKLAPGSFFWLHTGFAALAKSGRADDMPKHLGPWHESVGYGLSTFVEENSYWRSLCHAWSAHPVLEFQQRILGVTATEPGFAQARVAPHRCGLTHAAGSVCTPRGLIEVAWRVAGGKFNLTVTAPAGIEVTVVAPGGVERTLTGGKFEETFALS